MHILITGAGGMIGRKLTARLAAAGELNGQPIDRLTLIDVRVPARPEKFAGRVESAAVDIADPAAIRSVVAGRPDVIFHLAAIVSGEAELDFEKGMRVNLDGSQKAIVELLLADYTRRGFLDGVGIRLPSVVVRPGRPNKAASGFFSSIIREPLAGEEAVLPV